jgi:glycosyltransferase involved in cell wall biosynthesis
VSTDSQEFCILDRRYLGVSNIPYFVDDDGTVLLERSWHHDLVQHLEYLPGYVLAAPRRPAPADKDKGGLVTGEAVKRMPIVALPAVDSRLAALVALPKTALAVWRAIGRADIVHTGIAGWPYPLGWLAIPMARLRGKKVVVIVESAPWRPASNAKHPSLRKRIEAALYETLGRWGCRMAHVSFYTQRAYLDQFHRGGPGAAFVAPATWVRSEDLLDGAQAERAWDEKVSEPIRFLFAGRLVAEKGIETLLAAAQIFARTGTRGALHVIGDGPLRPAVESIAKASADWPFEIRTFDPIPYGQPFFDFLCGYHVAIIPSLTDEQPRIVFDAAARAVAVLASDTDGLRPHVEHRRTGVLFPAGDATALAQAMVDMANDHQQLRAMGLEALRRVRKHTHRSMHAERSQRLAQHLL